MSFLDLTTAPDSGFQPLAAGSYLVIADEAEMRTTRSGSGEYLNVKFRVLAPASAEGKTLWKMFNIKNENPKAVSIGMAQLKEFLKMSEHPTLILDSPLDLIGLRCVAVVKHRKDDRTGEMQAVISYFKPKGALPGAPDSSEPLPF